MRKTFFVNLLRDIKKTLSRFLSIVIIIAFGVAFYAGVRATSPDMKKSGDLYFRKNRLMDFKLISTLGLTEDDISEVSKLSNVEAVSGAYSLDAIIEKDNHSIVLNVNSMPKENGINSIRLVKGRRAENNYEVVVENRFFKENNLKLGDKILLKSGNETVMDEKLNNSEFEIVGTAEAPVYISVQRQLSSLGNGSVKGFLYIMPEVFKSEVYTEIHVKIIGEESKRSLLNNDKYKNSIKELEKDIKTIGQRRSEIRYNEVLKAAKEKIDEAEQELNKSKEEAELKFADSHKALETAENNINKGKKELKENEVLFNKRMLEGEKEISEGKKQLAEGEDIINLNKKKLEEGRTQIASAKLDLETNEKQLNKEKQQTVDSISYAIVNKLAELKKLLVAAPDNEDYIKQYEYMNDIYEKDVKGKDFNNMYSALKTDNTLETINTFFDITVMKINFDKAEANIKLGRLQLSEEEKLLQESEKELFLGIDNLNKSKKQISEAEIKLKKGKETGLLQLNSAKEKLYTGQKEIEENKEKLKSEEEKAKAKLLDGENEIIKNKEKLKDIKLTEWYVLGRSTNIGYETYRQDSDRIDNIGKAFPLIFFLVAALVSLTTMTRMVQEKRTEIGTFKALGYSSSSIVAHYLIYSLSASLIGSIIGISFGFKLFPPLIMNAYTSLYTIPEKIAIFNIELALQASLIAIIFTTIAAVFAALSELREVPASLMRPKPPKSGKSILLERVTFLWNRLSFTSKVTARNIFRYKQRFFMTVIGIAACTGLMITGFGLKEGITGAMDKQFSHIYIYDMQVTLNKNIDNTKKSDIQDKIMKDNNIEKILFSYSKNSSIKIENNENEDAYLIVPEKQEEFNSFVNLNSRGRAIKFEDNSVIITEKLAKLIDKKIGDNIEISINDKTIKTKITAITEQYLQHYIYMSPVVYKKIIDETLEFNNFYGLLKSVSEESEDKTSKLLTSIDSIGSVSFKNNARYDLNSSINSINSVVLVLIISAGVLAFVVIYNLTNININERQRELATIKLLGFYNNELAAYVYRENIVLTIIGSLLGIAFGIFLNNFVVTTAETNIMMFLRKVDWIYFLYSIILTIIFSVIVNLAMYGRFDNINMIESLKSAE